MPVPSTIDQISPTASLNSPAGSENVFPDIDNHIRALAAFTAQLRDGSGTNYTSPYLLKAGGTMTGALTLAADPASAMQAATKQYADTMLPLAGGRCEGPDAGMPERVGREAGVRIPGDGINGVMGAFGRIGERMRFVQARLEQVRRAGGDPFRDYQLPQAVLALRQGVGRVESYAAGNLLNLLPVEPAWPAANTRECV